MLYYVIVNNNDSICKAWFNAQMWAKCAAHERPQINRQPV